MEIATLGDNVIKIRSKNTSFVVDPVKTMAKVSADAILLLNNNMHVDTTRVLDQRIIICGEGEYEVEGVKISGIKVLGGIVYSLFLDSFLLVLGKVSDISRLQDTTLSCEVALLRADSDLKSIVAKLEPKIVVLYGEKKMEGARSLGKEGIAPVQKFTTLKDKVPEEMEVVILG